MQLIVRRLTLKLLPPSITLHHYYSPKGEHPLAEALLYALSLVTYQTVIVDVYNSVSRTVTVFDGAYLTTLTILGLHSLSRESSVCIVLPVSTISFHNAGNRKCHIIVEA